MPNLNNYSDEVKYAINNTKEKCKASHDNRHRPVQKLGSCTGYICKSCNKEIDRVCQVCSKLRTECKVWNAYYGSCEECL